MKRDRAVDEGEEEWFDTSSSVEVGVVNAEVGEEEGAAVRSVVE